MLTIYLQHKNKIKFKNLFSLLLASQTPRYKEFHHELFIILYISLCKSYVDPHILLRNNVIGQYYMFRYRMFGKYRNYSDFRKFPWYLMWISLWILHGKNFLMSDKYQMKEILVKALLIFLNQSQRPKFTFRRPGRYLQEKKFKKQYLMLN